MEGSITIDGDCDRRSNDGLHFYVHTGTTRSDCLTIYPFVSAESKMCVEVLDFNAHLTCTNGCKEACYGVYKH